MKKIILAAAIALSMTSAAAANQYYIEGFGGVTFNPDLDYGGTDFDMDTGYHFGGAFGMTVNDLDIEGEILYTESDYSGYGSNLNSTSIMLNVIYDFTLANTVEGYVGAGLGTMNVDYDGGSTYGTWSGDEWVFGGQVLTGARVPVAENVSLFAEYRYQHAADATIKGVDVGYRGHLISGGLRFEF